jgi:Domain of unknown function (DUF929)
MRMTLLSAAALLVMSAGPASLSAGVAVASPGELGSSQAQQTDFARPDVAPLPPDGKFQIVSDTPWPSEKVRVFFLGAQFCPFCAAERWALVSALERFGTLTDYTPETHKAGLLGFRLVPTYDLRTAVYTSDYLTFSGKEIFDKDNAPLDTLDADEQAIVDQFDRPGTFPLLMINGQYAQFDSGFSPALIDGMDFDTLRKQLDSGERTDATNAIMSEADLITRYLCHSTGDEPAAVCER